MTSDAGTGAGFGFVTGLVGDLLFDLPVGVSALVYTAVGFAVGSARVYVTSHRPLVHLVLAGAASLASVWCSGLLLPPFVYPVVGALTQRVPARPAQRW